MARITLILTIITAVIGLLGGFKLLLNEWRLWRAEVRRTGKWLGMVLMLCLLPSLADASCSGSGLTWSCTSGSTSAQIQTAMTSATDGATITFANGTYARTAQLSFDNAKGVTLICATVRGCTITGVTNTFWGCFCFSGTNTKFYRASGFIFDGGGSFSGNGVFWFDSNAGTTWSMVGPTGTGGFRIDNNTFQNAPSDSTFGVFVCDNGSTCRVSGVIDHNIWSNSILVVAYYFLGREDTDATVISGTSSNVFLEDNQLTFTTMNGGSGLPCTDAQGAGRYVVRFNTGVNCAWGGHGAKHAGGPQNYEFYGNIVELTTGAASTPFDDCYHCFHHQGSGEILGWGNEITIPGSMTVSASAFAVNDYRAWTNANGGGTGDAICDGNQSIDENRTPIATYRGYPCWHQATRTFAAKPNARLRPLYSWQNIRTDTGAKVDLISENNCGGSPCYHDEHFVQNRDFYYAVSVNAQSSPTSPFNGTSGVGYGTLANRPTTCTPTSESIDLARGDGGVAYWATDQGSWNTSSSNPYGVQRNGVDGVLYNCSATNTWTVTYTPYTYPHPLVSGEEEEPPAAPTNVRLRVLQLMELAVPLIGLTWHFRRALLAGMVVLISVTHAVPVFTRASYDTVKVVSHKTALKVVTSFNKLTKVD